ncbi:hypothetical protein NPS53_08765 [Pseudomonas putida]|uniref:hypothetical protein n=1 Tax=Pseudomonas putida TaxID=303 RepID=UPI002363F887|nr:hypothetical protein [Pseudomonas putida]MDD2139665.1 hypothetical protein [Pseudomonas putida]HDS1721589.1 hypothetical protein [Pseudomonas putida]
MKSKLKIAVFGAIATLAGISFGSLDNIQHNRQAAAQLHETCKAQPTLAACIYRDFAAHSVRYTFNGQEARDRNPVTVFGAYE